ncbi:hypothetical protein Ddc_19612 [Ditylenchus destructor]|nr:hypothetical protein Ddc_19612 [Ditylenchus destructor]
MGSFISHQRRMSIAQTGPNQSALNLQRGGRRKRLQHKLGLARSVHGASLLFEPPQNNRVSESASRIRSKAYQLRDVREQVPFQQIYACDETGVWLDPVGGKYVAEKGAKQVGF